jgi:integrase/recombinase XerC
MARANAPWFRQSKNAWYVTLADGRKKSLGVSGEQNEKEAVQAWHRLMAGMPLEPPQIAPQTAELPKAIPNVEVKSVSVQSVITAFLTDAKGRMTVGCLRNYRLFLTTFAERYGQREVESLTVSEAEAYVRKPKWSSTYKANCLAAIITAFRWAKRERLISRSPLNGLRKPVRASRGAKAIVSADIHARLAEIAPMPFKAFLQLLWLTGARPGEIARLKAEDIDGENSVVLLNEHKTAHLGKSRVLFLSPEAVEIIRGLGVQNGLLFPSENENGDGVMTAQAIGCRLRRLCIKAGVKHCIAYGYRHGFATDALANGVPDAQVAALLGHSGTAMLHKHYSHLGSRSKVLRTALANIR